MRHSRSAIALLSALAPACSATSPREPTMEERLAAWERAAIPGAEHRALDAFVGVWTTTVTAWWDPNEPPGVSTGTMTSSWMLDGRHLEQRLRSEVDGVRFEGFGTMGFDVSAGEYFSTWQDSMSTSLMLARGFRSKDGATFRMSSVNTDPLTGRPTVSEEVIVLESPDRHVMTMFETKGGQRVKTMEIVYVRAR